MIGRIIMNKVEFVDPFYPLRLIKTGSYLLINPASLSQSHLGHSHYKPVFMGFMSGRGSGESGFSAWSVKPDLSVKNSPFHRKSKHHFDVDFSFLSISFLADPALTNISKRSRISVNFFMSRT
jgi:hypothetical protein